MEPKVMNEKIGRLVLADPEIWVSRCIRRMRDSRLPMVIPITKYDELIANPNLPPELARELKYGLTVRGNHYFSPRNFCYDCNDPFQTGDEKHAQHNVYHVDDSSFWPYTGHYITPRNEHPNRLPMFITYKQKRDHIEALENLKGLVEATDFIKMYEKKLSLMLQHREKCYRWRAEAYSKIGRMYIRPEVISVWTEKDLENYVQQISIEKQLTEHEKEEASRLAGVLARAKDY